MKEKDDMNREELGRDPRIVFYYNREDRLNRMPKNRQLYDGELVPKRGFFRSLTGTKSNRALLVSVFFLVVAVMFIGFLGNKTNEGTIGGIPVKMAAFLFEDRLYVTLTIAEKKGYDAENPVEIMIGTYDGAKNLVDSQELFGVYSGAPEQFRTTFTDFEVFEVAAIIKILDDVKNISVRVDRK